MAMSGISGKGKSLNPLQKWNLWTSCVNIW